MTVTRDTFDDLLLDYVYGELASADRTAVEAYVAAHPEAQQALTELQTTRAAVSPLAADLEPSQIATNRVLAHARDAAEGMALSGRLWGLFPRYGTAMAALLAVAVGIAVVAPRNAAKQGQSTYEIAKGEDAYVRADREANERTAPALAPARTSLAQERDLWREEETELRARRSLAAVDALKADKPVAGLAGAMSKTVGTPAENLARNLDAGEAGKSAVGDEAVAYGALSEGVVGGSLAAKMPADAKSKRVTVVNRLAYQAPVRAVGQSVVGPAGFADGAQAEPQAVRPQSKVRKTNAFTYAEEVTAAAPPRPAAPGAFDYGGGRTTADRDANVVAEHRQREAFDDREATLESAPERTSIVAQMDAGRKNQVLGEHAVAVQYFQNVVAVAPAAPVAVEAQHETGRSLAELGDCPNAIVAFQDVLDNAPAYPRRDDVLLAQAACLIRVGNVVVAEERYRMAETEYPTQLERVQTERRLNVLAAEGRLKKARTVETEADVAPAKQ